MNRSKLFIFIALFLGLGAIIAGIVVAIGGGDSDDVPVPSPTVLPPTTPGPTPTNAPNIRDIIMDNARFGGSEFDNKDSYQSKAMEWVLTQSIPYSEFDLSQSEQTMQLYALACLFYSTFAVPTVWTDHQFGADVALPGWFDSRGWVKDAAEVCNWYGITCNSDGAVTRLALDTNGLTGSVPPELAFLADSLEYLDLYNNIVHNDGDEGNSFLGELVNLEYLYLASTSFQYNGIPTYIGEMTKLKELDLSYSLFFGPLQGPMWSKLTNLNYLVISGNSFNTSLPEELITLPELEYLYAGYSSVKSDLEFIERMPKIYEFWFDDNPEVVGTIPASLGDVTTMASFSVTGCNLSGSIPEQMAQMTDLVQLWFYDNKLTGTIPTEFATMKRLKILELAKNDITGTMPQGICENRRPFGRLEDLVVDCDGKVSCPSNCCTCCGAQCIST